MVNALGELFGDIASAIRGKTGDAQKMKPAEFPEKISEIETGADVSGVTATAEDVKVGKKFVDAEGNLVEGTGAREAEITITATSSNKKLEYWYIDDGVLKAMTIPYNTPTVVRRSFGETFTLMRYKTSYVGEDAVKPKITISGALYSERTIVGANNVSFFGYSFYVITPKKTTVTISIE